LMEHVGSNRINNAKWNFLISSIRQDRLTSRWHSQAAGRTRTGLNISGKKRSSCWPVPSRERTLPQSV